MGYFSSSDFYTVQEVALLLRLSVLTIYKYIRGGSLVAVEFGGHYRVSKKALEEFIEIHKVDIK